MDEIFELVDDDGKIVGTALRSQCHGNPALRHRAAHVVVFDDDGRILLQKRSMSKDVQPGRWDSAVGGHLAVGEDFESAARREMAEELGLDPSLPLVQLFDMTIKNQIEHESVRVFATIHNGPFKIQREEIDEIQFWNDSELRGMIASESSLTPNCVIELGRLLDMRSELPATLGRLKTP